MSCCADEFFIIRLSLFCRLFCRHLSRISSKCNHYKTMDNEKFSMLLAMRFIIGANNNNFKHFRFHQPLDSPIKNISDDIVVYKLQKTINDIMKHTKRIVFTYPHPHLRLSFKEKHWISKILYCSCFSNSAKLYGRSSLKLHRWKLFSFQRYCGPTNYLR